jgi:hypothetical protein
MHPYEGDTLIIIDIQAPNQLEILTCIRETFEFMEGWTFCSSVQASPTDARFYAFNLTNRTFEWWRQNNTFSDTMDEDEVAIKDLADISYLLEFVYLNAENLRAKEDLNAAFQAFFGLSDPTPPPPPKKRKKDNEPYYKPNLAKMAQKLKGIHPKPDFNPMVFVEKMNEPSANVYYKDFATDSGKALPYEATTKIKLGKIPKTSWAAEEEKKYLYHQQQKLHEQMVADIQKEIDKEILAELMKQYGKNVQEAKTAKTWWGYDQAVKQQKHWKMKFNSIPGAEGLMVNTSMPYNMVDSMDY